MANVQPLIQRKRRRPASAVDMSYAELNSESDSQVPSAAEDLDLRRALLRSIPGRRGERAKRRQMARMM